MVGHLAQRAFGSYRLPIPRPAGGRRADRGAQRRPLRRGLEPRTPTTCASGSASRSSATTWCWTQPHVRARLDALLADYVDGFEADPGALEDRFGALDASALSDPSGLQKLFGDPEVLLGAVRSERQKRLLPQLEALVAVVVGYVDRVMDVVGARVLGRKRAAGRGGPARPGRGGRRGPLRRAAPGPRAGPGDVRPWGRLRRRHRRTGRRVGPRPPLGVGEDAAHPGRGRRPRPVAGPPRVRVARPRSRSAAEVDVAQVDDLAGLDLQQPAGPRRRPPPLGRRAGVEQPLAVDARPRRAGRCECPNTTSAASGNQRRRRPGRPARGPLSCTMATGTPPRSKQARSASRPCSATSLLPSTARTWA